MYVYKILVWLIEMIKMQTARDLHKNVALFGTKVILKLFPAALGLPMKFLISTSDFDLFWGVV